MPPNADATTDRVRVAQTVLRVILNPITACFGLFCRSERTSWCEAEPVPMRATPPACGAATSRIRLTATICRMRRTTSRISSCAPNTLRGADGVEHRDYLGNQREY